MGQGDLPESTQAEIPPHGLGFGALYLQLLLLKLLFGCFFFFCTSNQPLGAFFPRGPTRVTQRLPPHSCYSKSFLRCHRLVTCHRQVPVTGATSAVSPVTAPCPAIPARACPSSPPSPFHCFLARGFASQRPRRMRSFAYFGKMLSPEAASPASGDGTPSEEGGDRGECPGGAEVAGATPSPPEVFPAVYPHNPPPGTPQPQGGAGSGPFLFPRDLWWLSGRGCSSRRAGQVMPRTRCPWPERDRPRGG